MTTRRASKLAASTTIALLSITGLSAIPASAISNGTTGNNSENLNVAKIVTGYGTCTGTLIDPQWIATAASCFTQNPSDYPNLKTTDPLLGARALFGTDAARKENTGTPIESLAPYTGTDKRDIVLAKLATPALNTPPMKLATTAPTQDEQLTFIGWGRTKTEWIPKEKKTGNFTTTTINPTEITITGTTPENPSLCLGDSGAPGIRTTPNGQELTAINSRSWQKNCIGTTQTTNNTAYATRTDDITNWIQTTINNGRKLDIENNQIVRINPAGDKNTCVTYSPIPRNANHTAYTSACDPGNQNNSQRFEMIEQQNQTNTVYALRDWASRQCLTNTNGTYLIQGPCDTSNAQKWDFIPGPNNTRYIRNIDNGKVLDTDNRGNLIQTDLNTESTTQRWNLTKESKALYKLPSVGTYVSVQTAATAGNPLSIRHKNGVGQVASIASNSPEADRKDATWKIVPGLADNTCISFQSLNFPQQYLSARDTRDANIITRGKDSATGNLVPTEATFCPRTGPAQDSLSFDWVQSPGYAIQNVNGSLKIGYWKSDRAAFDRDTSWKITPPWATPTP